MQRFGYPPRPPDLGGTGDSLIPRKQDIYAIGCLIGSTVCWGVGPVMLRDLIRYIPDGYTANLIRYPIASVVYLPWLIAAVRQGNLGRFWLTALIPTVVNVIGQTLWSWAPYYLGAGNMSFLVRLAAVWSALAALWVFPDERRLARSPLFWLGTSLAMAGFLVMSLAGPRGSSELSRAGIAIIFACGIFFGLYYVAVRYVMGNLDPLVVFAVVGNYTSIGLILLAPLGEPRSALSLTGWPLLLYILSALLSISLAHGMYYMAVQRLGVAVSSLSQTAAPFISVLGAWLFLDESFRIGQWAGGAVLVVGAALAVWSQQRLPKPADSEAVQS